jgi:hypothetical protein
MAAIFITEYERLARSGDGPLVMAGQEPNVAEQTVAVGGASEQSAAFNDRTTFVMIHTDTACCLKFGDSPTAIITAHRLAAGETRFYGVSAKQKVAVIAFS